jgi:hypothetical protein
MIVHVVDYDFTIDEASLPIFNSYKWQIETQPNNCTYLIRSYMQSNGIRTTIKLHRLLAGATTIKDGMVYNLGVLVDHKDRNTFNNTIDNLRFSTKSQNAMNSKLCSRSTSGHKGVSWKQDKQKWKAYLTLNKKQIHLGYYDKIEDAIEARINGARDIFGEFFAENVEVK